MEARKQRRHRLNGGSSMAFALYDARSCWLTLGFSLWSLSNIDKWWDNSAEKSRMKES